MDCIYKSPFGFLKLTATDDSLQSCVWIPDSSCHQDSAASLNLPSRNAFENNDRRILREAISQLDEYFRGERRSFRLPIKLSGTPFCQRVWQQLQEIPYGRTVTYKELAAEIENPDGARAVAMACSKNKLSVIIPCHRVIAANGSPGGYTTAGNTAIKGRSPEGIKIKCNLIQLETGFFFL